MGIVFFEVYWFDVNWLKFISRCDWLISFGSVSICFVFLLLLFFLTIICFLPFFLLFIQRVSLWILIFHTKVSNFLVDILKLQGNKFLKINKVINKRLPLSLFLLILVSSLILTSIIFGVPFISVSLFV